MKFIGLVSGTMKDIVNKDSDQATVWEKINFKNKFESLAAIFVEKLSSNNLFSEYFA